MPYKSEVAVGKHNCCQNEKEYNENSAKCSDWVVRNERKKLLEFFKNSEMLSEKPHAWQKLKYEVKKKIKIEYCICFLYSGTCGKTQCDNKLALHKTDRKRMVNVCFGDIYVYFFRKK